ncbi:uncharacterized protein B0H18DRAFT_983646 [Fomitopsis serialis]|uniref:uncharacterized protein n=1 Tax=Fomitopsis serialis TaxID=139415 RepID=UPI0020086C00|nr:uncharacterized protein B0H18DRAFT_983646 [Neoantrodia serialis]KAH9933429.1 hypothetical protein B0H18DRAFT_983646 [Neoantrodia serialis]
MSVRDASLRSLRRPPWRAIEHPVVPMPATERELWGVNHLAVGLAMRSARRWWRVCL